MVLILRKYKNENFGRKRWENNLFIVPTIQSVATQNVFSSFLVVVVNILSSQLFETNNSNVVKY